MAAVPSQTQDANRASELDSRIATTPIHGTPTYQPKPVDTKVRALDLSFLAPCPDPEALGYLDHFKVLAVRGRGGFGIVLRAYDEKLRRIVALKVLPAQLSACLDARRRFLREAQAAAAVHDDHVVDIFGVEEGPCAYIVMEYVDGPSLQEKIDAGGPMPLDEVLRIGYETACGLAAAHAQGLIHRDIKPGNILLEGGTARVKISDFGLARAVDDPALSQMGAVYGTPAFMAPEQADGGGADPRSDLFSLGSVLYTMATGVMPFDCGHSVAVLRRVIDDTPAPMRAKRPDLPAWFEDFVAKLHAKEPKRRYQTAREVADELARHLAAWKTEGDAYRPRRPRWGVAALVAAALVCVALAFGAIELLRGTPAQGELIVPVRPIVMPPLPEPPALARTPFDAAQAKAHQSAWAKHVQTPIDHVNTVGMKFQLVPAGEFPAEGDKAHTVRITKPYYIGVHEVTVAQFRVFVDDANYKTTAETNGKGGIVWSPKLKKTIQGLEIHWRAPTFDQTDEHPVSCMSWHDASAFCRWLSKREGKPYRLPTEAEWEFACRAGTSTPFHYGPLPEPQRMSMNLNGGTTPVGSFAANAFGLHDMHGNLYEWCLDGKRIYTSEVAIDPRGPDDGPQRAIRSGCYSSHPLVMRADARNASNVDHPYAGNGMRLVLECRE